MAQDADPLFTRVSAKAADLATRDYAAPAVDLPTPLQQIDYDGFRKIRFRKEHALWRNETLFEVEFFHLGFLYSEPITVHVVEDEGTRVLAFDTEMFTYRGLDIDPAALPNDLGFAGFRIHYPLSRPDYKDELAVFLGSSYFRVLGRNQRYGLSARGIAIDTAEASGEEFPAFREFWLVKPEPEATSLVVYALLDGPSLTGAYRFDIDPGAETVVDVNVSLFFRREVRKLGVAPLTSMFLYGENQTQFFDDFRPEVHDSDGLLMQNGTGEWIWRQLANPRELTVTSFLDNGPRGFGLMQRDRSFEHYADIESSFERRPSYWIEPKGEGWGEGSVQLVEIPSREEIHDNIVAYWVPKVSPDAGQTLSYRYSLRSTSGDPESGAVGRVASTRIGWAAVPGTEEKPPKSWRRFVVDFHGADLSTLAADQPVKAELALTKGGTSDLEVAKVPQTGAWRVAFRLVPEEDGPTDLRLFLTLRGEPLTETWSYLWSPSDVP